MNPSRTITTIDCEYLRPQFAAAYLLRDGNEAAFIDNNTAHAVPAMLHALSEAGLHPSHVRYLIVTHVHLDHSGGTSRLLRECPNATVLVHPRGRRHLVDPAKLVASAQEVYGAENFLRLYGEITAISETRVQAVEDDARIPFGNGSALEVFHTRGHANHHFCVFDRENAAVFSGDAFGVIYPALQSQGLVAIPSTSPTDFDYVAAVASIDRIVSTGCEKVYPTHFGKVVDVAGAAAMLKELLAISDEVLRLAAKSLPADADLVTFFRQETTLRIRDRLRKKRIELSPEEWEFLRLDLDLNAQGLAFVWQKSARP